MSDSGSDLAQEQAGDTGMALAIMVLTHIIGPKRKGPVKDSPYESGMPLVGDARRRFNVRFYIIAMLFLLFDVEVVLLWPCMLVLRKVSAEEMTVIDGFGTEIGKGFMLGAIGLFVALLVWGYLYDMKRGVLRWE